MLNKTLILSTILLYTVLLTLVGWQQAKVIPWHENTLLRIRFTRPDKPARLPDPTPTPFSFSIAPVSINQKDWVEIQFHTPRSPAILKLERSQSNQSYTRLSFEGGAQITLELKDEGARASLQWTKKGRAGELRLPFSLQPGYQWQQEQKQLLAVNGESRWLLASEYAPKIQNELITFQLPDTRKGEHLILFTFTPAPVPENAYTSDYTAYLSQLEQLVINRISQNTSSDPGELAHYLAATIRQGLTPKTLTRSSKSYRLAPYLGLELSVLRQQIASDQEKSAALLLRTPEQILNMRGTPPPATFLFNHYQLDKLRQLLRYSLSTLAQSSFEQKVSKLLVLSEILLINPVMVSAQGDVSQIDETMRQSILPAVSEWTSSPPALSLREQLKTIALLRNWSRYSDNPSAQKLAEQLTLQLQQYQDANGDLSGSGEEQVSLGEMLDWVGPLEYRSMERSVTPGFWIQGISKVQTDYRPGYFIRINSSFPAGKTQYLILRGIYFQPRQVFFDQKPQPYHNWATESSDLTENSWYYNRELKTLVIKATHPKENLVIDIPY